MSVALLLRLLPYIAAAAIAAGAVWFVKDLQLDVAEAAATTAKAERDAARDELDHLVRATALAEELVAKDLLTLRELAPKYAALEKRIRDYAKNPVSPQCSYVMEPFAAAADGLRQLEADRAGAVPGSSGRPAHSR